VPVWLGKAYYGTPTAVGDELGFDLVFHKISVAAPVCMGIFAPSRIRRGDLRDLISNLKFTS
jgi:hypothetical protein